MLGQTRVRRCRLSFPTGPLGFWRGFRHQHHHRRVLFGEFVAFPAQFKSGQQ